MRRLLICIYSFFIHKLHANYLYSCNIRYANKRESSYTRKTGSQIHLKVIQTNPEWEITIELPSQDGNSKKFTSKGLTQEAHN